MLRRPRILQSITARLILGLTLATTVLWCAAAAYAIHISSSELKESFDRTLVETAQHLLPLAAHDLVGREAGEGRGGHEFAGQGGGYLRYQIRNSSGQIVLRTHGTSTAPNLESEKPGFRSIGKYRLFTERDPATGLTITVAEAHRDRAEAVRGAELAMLLPLAGLIPLNILAIGLVVRGSMQRVRRLGGEIAARGERNLAPLDISGQPTELRPVAAAVARLVERLRAALDAERALAANSAHELRTPIAGALAQTQQLIAELHGAADRRRAREVEATLKRLSVLADKMMQLARVDAGVGLGAAEIDLVPALDLVVADCMRRIEAPGRVIYTKAKDARLVASMDMDAFAIAVRNLIDNAAAHGPAGGKIEVRVEAGRIVRVINEGSAVAADALVGLTRRFARGETHSAGAGLGLAIVETIMERTGGRLELFSPAPGRDDGFEGRLTLNVASTGGAEGYRRADTSTRA
ncbi:MAG: sensor histidine kinase [Acetobacteraceae bacterium]